VDPDPPAAWLTCSGCGHPFPQHAPGGGGCLWWEPPDPATRCRCALFRYVPAEDPPRRSEPSG